MGHLRLEKRGDHFHHLRRPRQQEQVPAWEDVKPRWKPTSVRHTKSSAANPSLIYGDVTGYRAGGPEAGKPGFDVVADWRRVASVSDERRSLASAGRASDNDGPILANLVRLPRLIEDARYATLREFVSATAVADRVTVR